MREKKFQVFVSSTFVDLKEERQAAVEAILSTGNIPAGMELFSAGDESQMSVIKRWIDESDIYLLILGGRYGSVDASTGKSYTQLEYEYAIEQKKPLFAIVINERIIEERVKLFGIAFIEQDFAKELKAFRIEVLKNLVRFWDDTKDIKIAIHETLSEFAYRKDLIGWIRGDNFVNAGVLAEEIARLTKENSELREKLMNFTENTDTKYNGLTYKEMKNLLSADSYMKSEDIEESLFDGLISIAQKLSNGIYSPKAEIHDLLSKLTTYRVAEEFGDAKTYAYRFSIDGHAFYLKTITNSL